ncbi:MAG: DNA-3-methyladenine glycosylase [Xenococcus sp. MO_188.B8]|nr:DNA-3-methyladenine glycosylase [Xenococcus sp. MO_188.B8]
MTAPAYWQKATDYLATKDQIIASIIASYPNEVMTNNQNPFSTLVKAIVGQQISIKAAATICQRLEALIGNFATEHYLLAKEDDLRQCGLSRPKIRYITNVANALESGKLTPATWSSMGDDEITKQLMSISGIGTWTAQMFLIFHLHRADILPLGDIGLINAIKLHYGSGQDLSKSEIKQLAQVWQPYRTVATWYLWRSLDPIPVQY